MLTLQRLVLAGLMLSPTVLLGQVQQAPRELLRAEITKLTAIHCEESTPAAVRSVNQRLLERRREAYASLLEQSIAQVRDYEIHSGIVLAEADKKDLDDAISPLEAELTRARQPLAKLCPGPTTPTPTNPVLASIDHPILRPVTLRSPASAEMKSAPATLSAVSKPGQENKPEPAKPDVSGKPPDASPAEKAAEKEYDPKIKPAVIGFHDTEVNTKAESSFSITNKGTLDLSLELPELCEEKGDKKDDCKLKIDDFALTEGTDKCSLPIAHAEFCNYTVTFSPTEAKYFIRKIKFEVKGNHHDPLYVTVTGTGTVKDVAHVVARGTSQEHPSFRSVVGLDITGATSSDTQQKFFVEFALNVPVGWWGGGVCVDKSRQIPQSPKTRADCTKDPEMEWAERRRDPLNRRLWFFLNPRITSIAQAPTSLSNLNVQGFTDLFSNKKTDLVQGVDVQGGAEYLLIKPRSGFPFFSSYRNFKARIGIALVAGAGIATPFSGLSQNPTVFTLDPNSPLRARFGVPALQPGSTTATFSNIAFVNQERSRFFRKYYAGFRLKSYHFSPYVQNANECDPGYLPACEAVQNAYPGIIDLTLAQDEQITGGHLSRLLFRADAVYPLPFIPGLHLFGSVNSVFKKNRLSDPLFLPGTSTTPISDPSVFIVKVRQLDRDVYHLGIGVDLLQVINKYKGGKANETTTPSAAAAAAPNAEKPADKKENKKDEKKDAPKNQSEASGGTTQPDGSAKP